MPILYKYFILANLFIRIVLSLFPIINIFTLVQIYKKKMVEQDNYHLKICNYYFFTYLCSGIR